MDFYKLDIKEVFQHLGSGEAGLPESEVKLRLEQYGPNRLAEEAPISRLRIFLHQFASPLIYILLISAVVTWFFEEYKDTAVILGVVGFNALIGFIQELKAEKSVRALKRLLVPQARVLRDGIEKDIPSEELVPGDVVLLESGSKVPADLRLFYAVGLRIDEAVLTGESLPVDKITAAIPEEHLTPGDQINLAFLGTLTVAGRGRGVVVKTGLRTVLGSIAEQVREIEVTQAPLQEKFHRFANYLGILILSASAVLFGLGVLVGESPHDMFMTMVAAAVAAIPEGLPVVVTITLARGVALMARRNALIRKLPAVETLGSTTVICTDKTGTLTKNEMTVKLIYDGLHVYEVTGSGYDPEGEILQQWLPVSAEAEDPLRRVLRIGLLCNEAALYQKAGEYRIVGDPTEVALVVSALKGGLEQERERDAYPLKAMLPFESERGYMATLHEHEDRRFIFVKGAPENVVSRCTACMIGNGERMRIILQVADNLAKEGLRVLAMAYKEVPAELNELTPEEVGSGLIVAGLQGMIDPPREEVIDAIAGCRRAGIRVIMITGDHAVTAQAISRQLGIGGRAPQVLTGRDLEELSDEELFGKVQEVSVFARVAPEHKLRIARQLMRRGEIVAMTGDGVNDTPALKAAHIGVAMGKSGTDAAREASDMVITDDNFASIFAAVREGRVVFDNIRKVTFFLIPTGVAAILSIIGTVILGLPLPYLPAQLLWINLVTNGLQVIALAFEPGEEGVVKRPPRDPREGIMSRVQRERTVIVGSIIAAGVVIKFAYGLSQGDSLDKARTLAMTTMVFFQFFQAWNSRSEYRSIFSINPFSNPFLLYALIAATFAQLSVIYLPGLQWLFRTEPLDAHDWLVLLGISLSVVVVVELDKWLRRRWSRRGLSRKKVV